jgi:hypothetical protein
MTKPSTTFLAAVACGFFPVCTTGRFQSHFVATTSAAAAIGMWTVAEGAYFSCRHLYQNDLAVHLHHHRKKRSCFKRCGLLAEARNAVEPGYSSEQWLSVAFAFFPCSFNFSL